MEIIKMNSTFVKQVAFTDKITVTKRNGYYEVREIQESKNGKPYSNPKIKTFAQSIGAFNCLIKMGFDESESKIKISELF